MINVRSDVPIYEIDGKETPLGKPYPTLGVLSHWNWDRFVRLEIGGSIYTVRGKDLSAAIENAQNNERH